MGSFTSYNTDDPQAGNPPLAANGVQIVGPLASGVASKLAGSVYSDVIGTAFVEQSFDGGINFDISQSIPIVAATGTAIDVDVLAPVVRIRYVNGAGAQAHLRIFARAFGNRGSG